MDPAGPHAPLRFGVFDLDPKTGELRRGGRRVKLHDKSLQVLCALIERPGELITRQDLQHRLWPADTFVDFDNNLNNAVSRLRDALGDDGTRYIETVPRRGYRFIAPVTAPAPAPAAASEQVSLPAPERPSPSIPDAAPPRLSRWPPRQAVGATLIVAGIAAGLAGVAVWRGNFGLATPMRSVRSIAVLPFVNLSGNAEHEYLADGMTEALTMELARMGALQVTARTSAMHYKGVARPVREIAKELGVEAVIEGSVMVEGDRLRVVVQLIDGASERHLWASGYHRSMRTIMGLQREVSRAITQEIRLALPEEDAARAAAAEQVDPEVYQLYLKGRHLLNRRTESELQAALQYFEQALAKDPKYALAHAGVASVWDMRSTWAAYVPPREGFPKARAAALRALELDDSLAEARVILASVHEAYEWDLPAAEREYQRAIAMNPSDAGAYGRYSMHLERRGDVGAAIEMARRAYELDPLSADAAIAFAMRLAHVRRHDEAVRQLEHDAQLAPDYFDVHLHLGHVYQSLGRAEEAHAAVRRGVELSAGAAHALQSLANLYTRQGRSAEAEAVLADLEKRPTQRNPFDIAMIHLGLGNVDRGLGWLETACAERTATMAFLPFALQRAPVAAVRDRPRFQKILRCVGTPP
jgi:TolB-like protein/DNA-binding winged helix-turn-helix (wHTH) protein/Tfp pilus assembly protein PilF